MSLLETAKRSRFDDISINFDPSAIFNQLTALAASLNRKRAKTKLQGVEHRLTYIFLYYFSSYASYSLAYAFRTLFTKYTYLSEISGKTAELVF